MEGGGGKGGFEKHYIRFKPIFIKVCIFVCAILYFLLVMLPSNNKHRLVDKILNYSSETSEDYKVIQDWQEILEIGGSDDENMQTKHFVYSAYLDLVKNQTILRVIAVIPNYSKTQVYCHVFDDNINWIDVLPATTAASRFTDVTYREAFILCNLENTTQADRIKFVSISPFGTANSTTTFSNMLKIAPLPPQTLDKEPHKFSLCVQPLFDYDKAFAFIQWMEFHKLMGVSHFTFYNLSIGPTVSCVMRSKAMNEANTVNVLQWTVPLQNSSLLHANGQFPAINDCVFRYRGVSKYVVSVDVDEMIIPNHTYARNYQQLIQVIDENLKKDHIVAQYQFRSVFFGFDVEQDSEFKIRQNSNAEIQLEDLKIYKHVARQSIFYPHTVRSKYITIPRNVIQPSIHSMWEGIDNAVELNIPIDFGFLHHYRRECPNNNCSNFPKILDYSAHFFTTQLLENVRRMMQKVKDECGYINIPIN